MNPHQRGCPKFTYIGSSSRCTCHTSEPLADWERELMTMPHQEGYGDLVITQKYGSRRVFEDVIVDSIEFRRGILTYETGPVGNETIHNYVDSDPYTFVIEYKV